MGGHHDNHARLFLLVASSAPGSPLCRGLRTLSSPWRACPSRRSARLSVAPAPTALLGHGRACARCSARDMGSLSAVKGTDGSSKPAAAWRELCYLTRCLSPTLEPRHLSVRED